MEEDAILPLVIESNSIIKVIGVGGGGGNAVNYLYAQGIEEVSFLVTNTDKQAMNNLSVPAKLLLGEDGLGAGGRPERGAELAQKTRDRLTQALDDGTRMAFVVAGMGGGTGTGAAPIVAEIAQEKGILTVGIVTIPFGFEGEPKRKKAMYGMARLYKHVDALLVINNDKLVQIYPELNMHNAFDKSNDVVANAAKAIAEIITRPGVVNTDFTDVYNTLKDGGVSIMNVGVASGETRIKDAIDNALHSPLMNTNNVQGAKRLLMQFYFSVEHAIRMDETIQINDFVEKVGSQVEVQWGAAVDDTLGENVRVTIIATGYSVDGMPDLDGNKDEADSIVEQMIASHYGSPKQVRDINSTLIGQQKPVDKVDDSAASTSENDGEEVVIDITEHPVRVPEGKQPTSSTPKRGFGWIRR